MSSINRFFLSYRVRVLQGDITRQAVGAIVNAANSSLLGGGGVDGAIHRAGGPEIVKECLELRRTRLPNGLPAGQVIATTAGKLRARHVIHTVGPIYGETGGYDAELLAACYTNSLRLASFELGSRTIAFPAISTGVYGFPREEAAAVSSRAIADFLAKDTTIEQVRLVFFGADDADVFVKHQRFEGDT